MTKGRDPFGSRFCDEVLILFGIKLASTYHTVDPVELLLFLCHAAAKTVLSLATLGAANRGQIFI